MVKPVGVEISLVNCTNGDVEPGLYSETFFASKSETPATPNWAFVIRFATEIAYGLP